MAAKVRKVTPMRKRNNKQQEQPKTLNITAYYDGYCITETLTGAEAAAKYTADKFDTVETTDNTLVVRLKGVEQQ